MSMLVWKHEHPLMAVTSMLLEEQEMIFWMSIKVLSTAINTVRRMATVRRKTRLEMVLIVDLTPSVLHHH